MLFLLSKFNIKYAAIMFNILLFLLMPAIAHAESAEATGALVDVVCNIVNFIKNSGLPVMGVALLIFCVLAIFLRLLLPLIILLIIFGLFFSGSNKVQKIVSDATSRGANIINSCNKS